MISIHPEWVQKILNGEKTIEVRPWIPKGELPLEVLIYVAKGEQLERHWKKVLPLSEQFILYGNKVKKDRLSSPHCLNGKVVAKFILNKAEDFNPKLGHPKLYVNACVSDTELVKIYPNKNILYAWKIDDLVIFDKPKELSEFKTVVHYPKNIIQIYLDYKPLKKAPQKMVWVEE
jgi:predicted transcriptional regulator